ncbi:MAG: TonB-dependent receptor plug domain-containing protein, partial [Eudoraea sp.]|nr:TonB-dependent receptor plug domain-containing protein [Eudoraea sp.]
LAQVTVTGIKKPKQEYSTQYKTFISPTDIIVQDPARPRSLLQMINELPGVNVVGIGSPNPQILILRRGGATNAGPPLWVVDGVPLFQGTSQDVPGSIFAQTAVGLVPALAIDRVEFLFGPPAAMYGTRAASGVFLVYTRDGADSDYLRRKDGQLKFKGFTPAPDISKVLKEQLKKRKRKDLPVETLYWNPSLKTDEQGQVVIQFKSPADFEQMELHVESITATGLKGSQKQVFTAGQ